jgi:isocitrate dehydrogenase kinase/phosphatase
LHEFPLAENPLIWLPYISEKRLTGFTATVTDLFIHSSTQISGQNLTNTRQQQQYIMDEGLNSKLSCRLEMILSNLQFNSPYSRRKRFKKIKAILTMKMAIRIAGMQFSFFKYCTIKEIFYKITQFIYVVGNLHHTEQFQIFRLIRICLFACSLSSMVLLTQATSTVITQ